MASVPSLGNTPGWQLCLKKMHIIPIVGAHLLPQDGWSLPHTANMMISKVLYLENGMYMIQEINGMETG